ncbi:hypothetical protein BCR42DRAFT_116702 [Absidia repens]|uniref:Uncharacterized protein n=1 Tax=Absidia repens TaxID=90262 RepID=A0A1X2I5I0_9FUNG|nr:hypothetical protein BCR42DRAFT_116702 [Absidia repens]
MTTTQPLQLQQQWLPTLSSIVVDGDSFSQELIRQFDKKRSKLHAEMGGDSTSFSSDSYNSRTRTPELAAVATPQVPDLDVITQDEHDGDDSDPVQIRRRSAGELLRRSSAYLRAKLEAFKSIAPPPPPPPQSIYDQQGRDISSLPPSEEQRRSVFYSWSLSKKSQQKSHPPPQANTIFNNSSSNSNGNHNDAMASSSSLSSVGSLPPTKVAVNTTISIPSPYYINQSRHDPSSQQPTPHHSSLYQYSAAVQPPVITQYPPRPLKYAPVEPISDHDIPYSNNDEHVLNTASPSHTDNNKNNNKRSVPRAALGPQHHRISLPLFKMANNNNMTSSSPSPSASSISLGRRLSRRSSESDVHRLTVAAAAAEASKSSMSTWSRTARRFSQWFNCHPTNKAPTASSTTTTTTTKKGKEPRNTTTITTDASTRAPPPTSTSTTNLEVHSLAI